MAKRTHVIQRSFAGGHLSEDMLGRIDNEKYPVGLAECINFITTPQGPAKNRSGFAFVLEVRDSAQAARLLPFSFSDDQTYLVILNGGKAAFSTDRGSVVEAAKAILSVSIAAQCVIGVAAHGAVENDMVYINGVSGADRYSYKVGVVIDANNYNLKHTDGTPVNSLLFPAYVSGGTMQRVYTVAVPYVAADIWDVGYAQSADVLTLTHTAHAVRELSRIAAADWTLTTVTFAPSIAAPGGVTITKVGAETAITYKYVVTAVAANGLEESLQSATVSITSNLAVAGNKITVAWLAVTGAIRYNLYKDHYGLFAFAGATEALNFTDDNIIPDASLTPPIANTPFSGVNNYPKTVCYFEQRRSFANTNLKPNTLWMTQSGTESNMTGSIPAKDNDAIQMRAAARELNKVQHLLPMSDLLMLTSSGEWMVTSRDSSPLSPKNISPREQNHGGANAAHPVLAANAGIYAQAVGGHLKSITLAPDGSGGYMTDDISILAADLFDGYSILDLAYGSAPVQIVWVVRSDGALLGMTYYPEHKVFGWHKHTTDGAFESVAVIREEGEDVLYVIVKRTVSGVVRRYVERMHSRVDVLAPDGVFSDAAHVYSGAAIVEVSGLWHLEGKVVDILADGATSRATVTGGKITVAKAAAKIIVGLPYTSRMVSMPLIIDSMPAGGTGLNKQINELLVRLKHSSVVSAGVLGGELVETPSRSNEPYGTPPALKKGLHRIPLKSGWDYDAQFVIEHTAPLPCTVTAALAILTISEN